MPGEDRNYAEIVELRKQVAEAERQSLLMRYQWDAFVDWRTGAELRLAGLEQRVSNIVRAEEIADAVAAKMRGERTLRLSRVQKAIALLVSATAIADGLRSLGAF